MYLVVVARWKNRLNSVANHICAGLFSHWEGFLAPVCARPADQLTAGALVHGHLSQ